MMRFTIGVALGVVVGCAPAVRSQAATPAAPAPARDGALLDSQRVAPLPPPQRQAWFQYLATSRQQSQLDRGSMDAELAKLGQKRWAPASEGPAFTVRDEMTEEWFRSAEGRRVADNLLSFQTLSGGWSKRVDLTKRPRQPGESYGVADGWSYIATFDNDATTEHLKFLAGAYRATREPRYRESFLKGLEYIFRAQFPNGCWPQVYPLQGSYHDAATFNDEAIPNILRLLREVGRGKDDLVSESVQQQSESSVREGVECILASQVVVNGRPTVWGAQHDPITLVPVKARAYEHASLSGGESTDVMEFLMGINSPDPRVIRAVHAAAAWFRETAIHNFEYEPKGGLVAKQGAGPIWARFYEIGTNRPIFSNRDGVIRYSWSELEDERRFGYAWYRDAPARLLQRYETWARKYPAAQ